MSIENTPLLRLASAEVDPPAQAADMARADAAPPPAAAAAAEAVADDRLDGPSLDDAPSFLRAADRAAYWRRPTVRAATSAAILVATAALVMQAGLLWHDLLAAHVPALAPALRSLCAAAGCSVQPLQRGEQISVESSGLNRVEGSGLYRLQLVLRNRADTVLQLPALDLTLTDNQGRLVARRVLRGADLGLVQDRLERGQELPIRAVLSVGDRRIDGYTVEAFYP